MLKPESVTNQIQEALVPYFDKNERLSTFQFNVFRKRIEDIDNYVEQQDTLGLLYSIQRNDDLMIHHYEKALSVGFDLTIISHYSVSLLHRSLFIERKKLLYEYKDCLNSQFILRHLSDVAFMYLDINTLSFIQERYGLIIDDLFSKSLDMRKEEILKVRNVAKFTDNHINIFVDICSDTLRKYNMINLSEKLTDIAGGHYVVGVETNDINILVDMNFELAEKIVSNSEMDSCELTFMFKKYNKVCLE